MTADERLADVLAACADALADEREDERELVLARVARQWPVLLRGLEIAYGTEAPALAGDAVAAAVRAFAERPADLRLLDLRRMVEPDWFQQPSVLGYACYTDRFAGTLAGIAERVDHLAELGVTYLHLMPLLTPRPRPNDGGYAVADFTSVRPDLGTMDDLAALAATLRSHGISLTLDLVLNHVAREHAWAQAARDGEERYRGYFHVFADRSLPDAYEATLPEVFPDFAPGSFTWDDELGAWVWTTFNAYQWDLNWHNPAVFLELATIMLELANQGVECLRLDAIAFLWKRVGTDCQNQPEVHAITQALHAITRIAAPSLALKAEAIVGPSQLLPYLGTGEHAGLVSDLAYHNTLMVQTWSALASGDSRLASVALQRFRPKPTTAAWATYVRCHDDIGWAIDDWDAERVGWNGHEHRRFLSDWYAGEFPGSTARGLVFQHNEVTGDRRISGSAAALAGLDAARDSGDEATIDLAVRRYLLAHAIMLGFGGVPLVYMGDEVALPNDDDYAFDAEHADDNRWAHRPQMAWDVVARRLDPTTVEHRVWTGLRHLVETRSQLAVMHASIESEVIDPANPAVLAWRRQHPRGDLVALHNVTATEQWWPRWTVPIEGPTVDTLTGAPPPTYDDGVLQLEPYAVRWLRPPGEMLRDVP